MEAAGDPQSPRGLTRVLFIAAGVFARHRHTTPLNPSGEAGSGLSEEQVAGIEALHWWDGGARIGISFVDGDSGSVKNLTGEGRKWGQRRFHHASESLSMSHGCDLMQSELWVSRRALQKSQTVIWNSHGAEEQEINYERKKIKINWMGGEEGTDSWWHIYKGTITTEEFSILSLLRARWVTDGERCLFNSFPGRRDHAVHRSCLGEETCVPKLDDVW